MSAALFCSFEYGCHHGKAPASPTQLLGPKKVLDSQREPLEKSDA